MFIERINEFEQFRELRSAWDAVYRRDPEAQYFLSWTFLAGALESHPGQWTVLVARAADGSCLGFLPLQLKTVWSRSRERLRNEIHFAGRLFWSDYGGLLCLPEHDEPVVGALASHLGTMSWSQMYLKGFRISDRRFELFMRPLADDRFLVQSRTSVINEGETDNLACPYLDLPETFETYLAEKLSGNTRQKIRRFLRKVESSPDYEITTTDAATRSRDLGILEELWCSMWSSQYGEDTRRLASKYRTILEHGFDAGAVQMTLFWCGESPLGALASFVDREKSRLLFFLCGRRESFRELPVGLVLHIFNIRWAIENGIRTYDFLRGDEPYKYSLGAVDARLRYPSVRRRQGTDPGGRLDPVCFCEALRLAEDFVRQGRRRDAVTVCRQILATSPGQEAAEQLLSELVYPVHSPAS